MQVGFFDLETTALDADFGQLLCGVIGEYDPQSPEEPGLIKYELDDFDTPEGRCDDKGLAVTLREELSRYDLIVSYNGSRFDIPFLNTRLAAEGERGLSAKRHKDLLYVMRYKFRLQSNSLKNVGNFFFGHTVKTDMDKRTWRAAHAGSRTAYNEVIDHCRMDVIELARVWHRVKDVAGPLS